MVLKSEIQILNTYYRLKGMGLFAMIPVIVMYIIIPVSNWAVFQYFRDMEMLYQNIILMCQNVIPLFSVWHVMFILYHFVEEPGNEVLYIFSKDKVKEFIVPYILYAILMLPLFFVYTRLFPKLWFFYLKLCAVNLMYMTFSYAAAFLMHSISVSIICILLYTIYQMSVYMSDMIVFHYEDVRLHWGEYVIQELVPSLVMSFIFLAIGKGLNKYWMRYK